MLFLESWQLLLFTPPKCQFFFLLCTIIKNRIHNCDATAFWFLPTAGHTLSFQCYQLEKLHGFLILPAIIDQTWNTAPSIWGRTVSGLYYPCSTDNRAWTTRRCELVLQQFNAQDPNPKPVEVTKDLSSYFRGGSDQKFRTAFSIYVNLNTCLCPTEVSRTQMHLSSPRHAPVLCRIQASARKAVNYSAF